MQSVLAVYIEQFPRQLIKGKSKVHAHPWFLFPHHQVSVSCTIYKIIIAACKFGKFVPRKL